MNWPDVKGRGRRLRTKSSGMLRRVFWCTFLDVSAVP